MRGTQELSAVVQLAVENHLSMKQEQAAHDSANATTTATPTAGSQSPGMAPGAWAGLPAKTAFSGRPFHLGDDDV